ncbi:MAG: DUF2779 domain-containing protein [Woeseiaceae bacterium]
MAQRPPQLSKSRLLSAWQCPKKLFLETFRPELAVYSAQTEALFATGHQVGDIAEALYGTAQSVVIPFNRRTDVMLSETDALLHAGASFPIFEATFRFEGVLVRVDVLLPDGDRWRAIEVKAGTSVKDHYVLDCAIQDWVMRQVNLPLSSISLAHIDNQFVFPGGSDYDGLLTEVDLTGEVRTVEPTVDTLVERARAAVTGEMPEVQVGAHCSKPYDCPFVDFCWPTDAEYPISGLGGSKAKLGNYVAMGHADIRDVDASSITSATQARIHRVTQSGEPEVIDGARKELELLPFPRYYLDFETIAPAVPFWPGTRPYAAVPVQWSCHIDDGSAEHLHQNMRHEEFLDLSGEPPMRALAEALIRCLGDDGPIVVYTRYEERVINSLIDSYPDLADALHGILRRLFDLHPVVKANYYHPQMLGSWSIKAVLPTIAPQMDYSKLEGIKEGSAASNGFIEAIAPTTCPARRVELEEQLRRYCKFDTQAMAEIVRFFCRQES